MNGAPFAFEELSCEYRHIIVTILPTPLSLLRMSEHEIRFKRLFHCGSRSAKPYWVSSPRIFLALLIAFAGFISRAAEPGKDLSRPSELFKVTNVWSVHFKFTPKQ